jgi:four helix bundle protein
MSTIRSHRDLTVWQKGMDLVEQVYALTRRLPPDERFRLVSQSTRAAVSVPANIAEGHSRGTRRDYAYFVSVAKGSLMELETYVMVSQRLGYVGPADVSDVLERISDMSKMLTALRQRLTEPRP